MWQPNRKHSVTGKQQTIAGLVALAGALLVLVLLRQYSSRLAFFLAFGLAYGFVLQRSNFCFVSGFSNLYLFRDTRTIIAVLSGMFVATIGFTLVMYQLVPHPETGDIPLNAHAAPFGWYLVVAGLLFGVGMVLAGNCIAGALFRLGEGSLSAVVSLIGIILGVGLVHVHWGWWWQSIEPLPRIWLPNLIGWPGAVALTLGFLSGLIFCLLRIQRANEPLCYRFAYPHSFGRAARHFGRQLLAGTWPVVLGGLILGSMNALQYWLLDRPWGITGEISRWTTIVFEAMHLPLPEVTAVPGT